MKQLNEMIGMANDYPSMLHSVRGQTKCKALGHLRLHLTFVHKEPDEPTLDRRNELDFEREARERYEAKLETGSYVQIDYLARAKSYAAVLLETLAADIYDKNTLQDSIDFMCKPYVPSEEEAAFLTAPELEVQKWDQEKQVASWRKHEVDICTTINDWMTSNALAGCDYPEDLPEMLQKAVKAGFKGLRAKRAKTLTGKLKGDRALSKESFDAGVMDLTALQNSF